MTVIKHEDKSFRMWY